MRWILLPLGIIHWGIIRLRNILYDHNFFKSRSLPRPVISVGNIQMGGTGKTPLVIELIKALQQAGFQVGVLTRGYKRGSKAIRVITPNHRDVKKSLPEVIGDEAALLWENLSGGALGVGGDRYTTGSRLLATQPVDVFLLDDGFQHRQLQRDLDICLIDVSRWRGHPFLFPFSYLRDCRSSLRRADVVILTRHKYSPRQLEAVERYLASRFSGPVWKGHFTVTYLTRLSDAREMPLERLKEQPVAAISGIANPHHFYRMLEDLGTNVVWRQSFGDHHHFTPAEVNIAVQNTRAAGAELLLVTEKDGVKLESFKKELGELAEMIWMVKIKFQLNELPILIDRISAVYKIQEKG